MDDRTKRLLDKSLETTTTYWNALVTINGIFLSVFSVTIISNIGIDSLIVYVIIILSIFSLWLLLNNFRMNKNVFFELGKIDENSFDPSSGEKLIQKSLRRHKIIRYSEHLIEMLFLVQTILIIIIIFCN